MRELETEPFSTRHRQLVLDSLIFHLKQDEGVAGVVIFGSGTEGFVDPYSDIDLCVILKDNIDITASFMNWKEKVYNLCDVMLYTKSKTNSFLHVFLLEGFLEVDISFTSLASLKMPQKKWRVLVDNISKMDEIIQSCCIVEKHPKSCESFYLKCMDSVWHYILRAVIAVKRNSPWRAIYELQEIRTLAISLRGIHEDLESRRYKCVYKMNSEFLQALEMTLNSSSKSEELMKCIKEAVNLFFKEARYFDELFNLDISVEIEGKMQKCLHYMEGSVKKGN